MRSRKEIKEEAKKQLDGNVWSILGNVLLITFIFSVIAGVIDGILCEICAALNLTLETKTTTDLFNVAVELKEKTLYGQLIELIGSIIGVIGSFAITYYVLSLIRGSKKTLSETLTFVKENLVRILVASIIFQVIMSLEIFATYIPGVVGSLLAVCASIVVIIATFGLALVQPIAMDYPELTGIEIIKKSWEMMNGHKFKYFIFTLSFIGWFLLCLFIIPLIYVIPYVTVAELVYYEEIKKLN